MDGPTQMLVTLLDYSSYVGKIAIGRLYSGTIHAAQSVMHITAKGEMHPGKIAQVYVFRDLQRTAVDEVQAGNIVAISGLEAVGIGDTIADINDPQALPPITVEEPTVRMTFAVNDSPFAGREGDYLTSRQIRARLMQELEKNVALRVQDTELASEWIVSGRGELHLAVLIETMRREGYEFSVSRPEVILKETESGLQEPMERLYVEVHQDYLGAVSEMLGRRRAQMQNIRYGDDGTVYAEYVAPTRGILGLRQPFLTATRGTGIFNTLFHDYEPFTGEIDIQDHGSLVALETGVITAYALAKLQQRGDFIVKPGDEVYAGQVVGEHIRAEELVINVVLAKHLTNFREKPSATTDMLGPTRVLSLDDAIQFLGPGDLLEVTPSSLRIRKKELRHDLRQRAAKKAKERV
jgi:GTP-binding protein